MHMRGGIYPRAETFELTTEDSGTAEAPMTWRAHPGESVHLSGGRAITGFQPITDPAILNRIDRAHHGSILQTDLRTQGITDYGELKASRKAVTTAGSPTTATGRNVGQTLTTYGFTATGPSISPIRISRSGI